MSKKITASRTTKGQPMTDTERLDFLEKRKIETRWSEIHEQWILGTYESNGEFYHWARNTNLRTAIDDAIAEMRGFRNASWDLD